MTINIFAHNITGTMHDVETRYWDPSGLYCCTQISI